MPRQEEHSFEEPPRKKKDERLKNDNNNGRPNWGVEKTKECEKEIEQLIIHEYKDPSSPAFGKTASNVKRVALKKYPALMDGVSDKRVRQILEEQFTTYSRMRVTE